MQCTEKEHKPSCLLNISIIYADANAQTFLPLQENSMNYLYCVLVVCNKNLPKKILCMRLYNAALEMVGFENYLLSHIICSPYHPSSYIVQL
jgi:hypothetical protein